VDASNSDKLQPPKIGGAFARKRREKEERALDPASVIPDPAPAPIPPQPEPTPAPTPVPAPDPIPDPVPPPSPLPAPDPIPDPTPQPPAPAPVPPQPEPVVAQAPPVAAHAAAEPAVAVDDSAEHLARLLPLRRRHATEPEAPAEQTAVLTRVREEPAPTPAKALKAHTPKRLPTLLASVLAGAASGGVLIGAIWAFGKWGGEDKGVNALQLLVAFVGSIVVGVLLLALGGISHRTAIAFLGTGAIAVVMMFFPSDNWQTVWGAVGIVVGVALLYAAAHAMTHEATGDR
jgi:hypothetical protein